MNRGATQIIGVDLSEHAVFRGAVLDIDGRDPERAPRSSWPAAGARRRPRRCSTWSTVSSRSRPLRSWASVSGRPGIVDPSGIVIAAPNLGWSTSRTPAHRRRAHVAPGLRRQRCQRRGARRARLRRRARRHDAGQGRSRCRLGTARRRRARVRQPLRRGRDRPGHGRHRRRRRGARTTARSAWRRGSPFPGSSRASPRRRSRGSPSRPVLREAGQRLGVALAPIVGALNLSEVVLSGPDRAPRRTPARRGRARRCGIARWPASTRMSTLRMTESRPRHRRPRLRGHGALRRSSGSPDDAGRRARARAPDGSARCGCGFAPGRTRRRCRRFRGRCTVVRLATLDNDVLGVPRWYTLAGGVGGAGQLRSTRRWARQPGRPVGPADDPRARARHRHAGRRLRRGQRIAAVARAQ